MVQYNDYPTFADFGTHFSVPFNVKQTETGYEAETVNVTEISKEEILKALIKRRYTLDDELAIINNKEMVDERYLLEYEEYKQYRLHCKQLAEEIITNI